MWPLIFSVTPTLCIAWFRGPRDGWMFSLWWRLAVCLIIGYCLSPVTITCVDMKLIVPAHELLDESSGYFGYIPIAIISSLMFGVWSLAIAIKRRFK